jgi:hypothetical protein
MKYLLNIIQPENNLTEKLDGLFTKYSNVDPNALGMKINWQNEPLWAYQNFKKKLSETLARYIPEHAVKPVLNSSLSIKS